MELRDDQEQTLNDVGEAILAALTTVAQAAQRALSDERSGISSNALVLPNNAMVGDSRVERTIDVINSALKDDLRRLLREPFVARVEVDWAEIAHHLGTSCLSVYDTASQYGSRAVPLNVQSTLRAGLKTSNFGPTGRSSRFFFTDNF